jgi:acyl carrier protein
MSRLNPAQIADRVEQYVRIQFRVSAADTRFSRSVPLFETGYVDSVGLVELLTFLAEDFSVELPDEALMSDEFSTIDGIAVLVARYGSGDQA